MLSVFDTTKNRRGSGLSRRELLRAGGLSLLGVTSAELIRLQVQAAERSRANNDAKARSCIFIFLFGGPSHIDLWDMKPTAPAEIRGQFQPASTNVAGIQICEHLPKLSAQMDKLCLLRSMTHEMPVHGPACSEIYSGRPYFGPPVTDQALPQDWPSVSSLVMRFGKSAGRLPPSIVLPWHTQFSGQAKRIAGQTGGRMGERFNPVLVNGDPSQKDFEAPGMRPRAGLGIDRLNERSQLLRRLEFELERQDSFGPAATELARHAEMAHSMLQQPEFAKAFELRSAPNSQRERYGYTKFGQSLLLARRLVEAGVSLVTVNWDDPTKHDKVSPFWDTHHDNFPRLKDHLCPLFDQSFSAFLQDMHDSGLLESTLVVALGEFGRTPKIGEISQNGMTKKTGRDHWPHAFTALVAGGGAAGGQVIGATTPNGGYIAEAPVSPADLAATVFAHLGVDRHAEYFDKFQNVPQQLCEGKPVKLG